MRHKTIVAGSAIGQLAIGIFAEYFATTALNTGLENDSVIGAIGFLGIWTAALFAAAVTARPTSLSILFVLAFLGTAATTTVLS